MKFSRLEVEDLSKATIACLAESNVETEQKNLYQLEADQVRAQIAIQEYRLQELEKDEQELLQLEKEAKDAAKEAEKKLNKIGGTTNAAKALRNELIAAKEDLKALVNKTTTVQETENLLKDEVQSLQQQLDRTQQTCMQLEGDVQDQMKRYHALQKTLKSLGKPSRLLFEANRSIL